MTDKPIFAVGLDAGSHTRIAICALEGARIRYMGHGSAECRGWLKGRIADQTAVTDSIAAALSDAESEAGVSVESAVVGIGGPTVRGAAARGAVELGYSREIEQRDVNRVMERAARVQLPEDCLLLQMFPQDFVVDGHPGHRDPRKMVASRLEVNAHLITVSKREHMALVGAVNQAHLAVEETVFEALAACYASVQPEERREGIALIDIGAQSTQVAAYFGDALHLAATVRVSGDHFSRDLAQPFRLSFADAESVKLEYGSAVADACPRNAVVELPEHDMRGSRECSRRAIGHVLEARSEDLFAFVQSELERVGMAHALHGGVFLTGGGARLPDLCDVAERMLHCHARYGLPTGIGDWPDELNDPEWSVAAGLAMYSAKLQAQTQRQREEHGLLGKILR